VGEYVKIDLREIQKCRVYWINFVLDKTPQWAVVKEPR
jgi:hypothetical protein